MLPSTVPRSSLRWAGDTASCHYRRGRGCLSLAGTSEDVRTFPPASHPSCFGGTCEGSEATMRPAGLETSLPCTEQMLRFLPGRSTLALILQPAYQRPCSSACSIPHQGEHFSICFLWARKLPVAPRGANGHQGQRTPPDDGDTNVAGWSLTEPEAPWIWRMPVHALTVKELLGQEDSVGC